MTCRATLDTVARHAGVSLATASKVLNDREGVSDATRTRVRASMSALGYRPTTSRAPTTGSAIRRVCVTFSEISLSMYIPEVFNALLIAAQDAHMELLPRLLEPDDGVHAADWLQSVQASGAQGVVVIANALSPEQIEACERAGLPIVAIDNSAPTDSKNLISISSNNFAGGYAAGRHLLDLGHRRFGLIHGREAAPFARERAFGFIAALNEADITLPDEFITEAAFAYESGLTAGRQMLSAPDRPTAIVAHCDPGAIGVMEAARTLGISVPTDLSVVGFDDSHLAQWSTPQLTTIRQPLADIARLCLRTMGRMIEGKEIDSPHIQLATKLVVRDSTGPAPVT